MVCHQIGDGEIILMSQACHHRYGVVRQEAAKRLVVEHCQVFPAATAAGEHQSVQSQLICALGQGFQGADDRRCHGTLHWNWHHDQLRHGPAFRRGAEHVGQGGTGHAGEHRDRGGLARKRPLMAWVDDPLLFQQLPHPFKVAQHRAEAGPDVQRLNGEAGSCCPEIELAHHGDAVTVFGLIAQLGQLRSPHHTGNAGGAVGEGEPEVALFELWPGDRCFQ